MYTLSLGSTMFVRTSHQTNMHSYATCTHENYLYSTHTYFQKRDVAVQRCTQAC